MAHTENQLPPKNPLPPEKQMKQEEKENVNYYQNRELAWLAFNERVLNEGGNPGVPLAERLGFASIYQSNLDDFFRVRVGNLLEHAQTSELFRDDKTNMTADAQIKAILKKTKQLERKKEEIYAQFLRELQGIGVHLLQFPLASQEMYRLCEAYFQQNMAPYLSIHIVGKHQPFPFLKNKEIHAVASLRTKHGKRKIALVPCDTLPVKRLISVPSQPGTFVLLEELILQFLPQMLPQYEVREIALLRLTRSADMDTRHLYDEPLEYRDAMELLLRQRKRMRPVRMELSTPLEKKTLRFLCKQIQMEKKYIFVSNIPLDLSFVTSIQKYVKHEKRKNLCYPKHKPQLTSALDATLPLIPQILKKDVLLSYPFESMKSFLRLLQEAAYDNEVVSIKITLYRLAKKSRVIDALVEAAEQGKEVTVLVELRARFDEERNISYSKKLEEAGCHVLYGLSEYKVHSKLCLITKNTVLGISRITQIGTGNYNEKTATLYTDLSLLTTNPVIGAEAERFFNALQNGETVTHSDQLLIAPHGMRDRILAMIEEEIAYAKRGEPAYLGFKINALTDKVLIDKLVEASQAGVTIEMIVRGICCLLPGIPGYTENITVISIVGRYLEHSRIYRFGAGTREKMYLASADLMTRNMTRRVEIAAPILDAGIKNRLRTMFAILKEDDEKGKAMLADGTYADRYLHDVKWDSQEIFYQNPTSLE